MTPFGAKPDFRRDSSRLKDVLNAEFLQAVKDTAERTSRMNVGAWDVHGLNLPEHEPDAPLTYVRIIGINYFDAATGATEYAFQLLEPQDTVTDGVMFKDTTVDSALLEMPLVSTNPDIPIDGSAVVAIQPGQGGAQLYADYPARASVLVEVTNFNTTSRHISYEEVKHQGNSSFTAKSGGMVGNETVNWAIEPNNQTVAIGDIGYLKRGYCPGAARVKIDFLVAGDVATATHGQQNLTIENAQAGTFTLMLSNQTTAAIPFNTTSGLLQSSLNNLTLAPAVTVTGSNPFAITFGTYTAWGPLSANITNLRTKQQWLFVKQSTPQQPIPVEVIGRSGFAYEFREQEQLADGSMATLAGGFTGNLTLHTLYEVNERTDVPLNTTVFAFPGYGWENGYSAGSLWEFEHAPPSTSNLTSVTDLTVTNTFQSDNQTTLYGNVFVNANTTYVAGFNYTLYSPVHFYTANTTFNTNSTLNIYAPTTFYTSIMAFQTTSFLYIYAPTFWFSNTHTYNGTFIYNYFGGNVTKNFTSSNLTLNFTGNFNFTICGNTTICNNKTLTLPTIKGNNALNLLQIIPKPAANVTLPALLAIENAALQTTMISTPSTSADSGTMQLYFKGDEKLYKRNSAGTETEIAVTGSGTSAGAEGDVQFAAATPGDFDYEPGGPTHRLSYDKTAHKLRVYQIQLDSANAFAFGWLYADITGNINVVNQGAAVADATGAGDVVAQLNTLLARLRNMGIIAT